MIQVQIQPYKGKGVIPSKKYPNFLQELFIKGKIYLNQDINRLMTNNKKIEKFLINKLNNCFYKQQASLELNMTKNSMCSCSSFIWI